MIAKKLTGGLGSDLDHLGVRDAQLPWLPLAVDQREVLGMVLKECLISSVPESRRAVRSGKIGTAQSQAALPSRRIDGLQSSGGK